MRIQWHCGKSVFPHPLSNFACWLHKNTLLRAGATQIVGWNVWLGNGEVWRNGEQDGVSVVFEEGSSFRP